MADEHARSAGRRADHAASRPASRSARRSSCSSSLLAAWWLYLVREVVVVAFLALIIAAAIHAPVAALEARGVRRVLAVLIVYLVLFAVVGVMLALLIPPLVTQARAFAADLPNIIGRLSADVNALLAQLGLSSGGERRRLDPRPARLARRAARPHPGRRRRLPERAPAGDVPERADDPRARSRPGLEHALRRRRRSAGVGQPASARRPTGSAPTSGASS